MSTAETPQPGFELVIAPDGSIPADALARFGLGPGQHLWVVPDSEHDRSRPKKKLKGALVGKINVEAFEAGMAWGEEQRIAEVEGSDNGS